MKFILNLWVVLFYFLVESEPVLANSHGPLRNHHITLSSIGGAAA
jgi:hypothetical protein